MAFDEVFVTGDPASPALSAYLDRAASDDLIVYIDVDSMWGSGFNPDTMLKELEDETGYAETEHLYRYGLSDTYLLRR